MTNGNEPKRPMTPAMQAALTRARAAVEKKLGKIKTIVSGTVIDGDGNRHPVDLGGIDLLQGADQPPETISDDVTLIETGDNEFALQQLPPKHLREAAHAEVGKLLRELQRRYDSDELKCLAAVWSDAEGTSFPAVAGMNFGDSLGVCLTDLAKSVEEEPDGTSDDDQSSPH